MNGRRACSGAVTKMVGGKCAAGGVGHDDLLAMSARTALSHRISSSSDGALSRNGRFVVMILNVFLACDEVPPNPAEPFDPTLLDTPPNVLAPLSEMALAAPYEDGNPPCTLPPPFSDV